MVVENSWFLAAKDKSNAEMHLRSLVLRDEARWLKIPMLVSLDEYSWIYNLREVRLLLAFGRVNGRTSDGLVL